MTPAFVTWIIHVGLDSFVCDMPRVWQYESFTAWRGSCHIWTNASFLISSMWHDPRDSHAHIMHTWIRHVAYKWVMSHIKKWVFFIRHMTDVIRMHICIRHVTCKWVMSHMNDMYGIVNRSCVTSRDSWLICMRCVTWRDSWLICDVTRFMTHLPCVTWRDSWLICMVHEYVTSHTNESWNRDEIPSSVIWGGYD